MRRPQVVFFGSGPVAKASLGFILQHFAVEAVITKPTTELEMKDLAVGIPVYSVQTAEELDNLIVSRLFKSRLGILVDFGVIVSKSTIDYFPLGIVNSHFSLLPEWRGADPITFAILSGQSKTGVSLMLIDENMDTGKLIAQKSLPIKPDATTPSLTKELIDSSNFLLANYVPKYLSGKIKPRAQPHPKRATYSRKLTKSDGIIDWTKPVEEIEREIRAFQGWPGSRTRLAGKEVIITSAHSINESGKAGETTTKGKKLLVYAGRGALSIDRLKPAGKREMTAREFLSGYGRSL